MTKEQAEWLDGFNERIKDFSTFLFCTRDIDLQRKACEELNSFLLLIAEKKQAAIELEDEAFANILLGCESLVSAFFAEIRMWILLKEGDPDKAWNELVNAQGSVGAAIKADAGFGHLTSQVQRLQTIEENIFPPQVFFSSGMIVKEQICGICGADYEACGHIKGKPYMGRFCTVRLIPLEINHVAIVDVPANKHCRVREFSVGGGRRNKMTWKVTPDASEKGVTDEGLKASGVIATTSTFDEGLVRTNRALNP